MFMGVVDGVNDGLGLECSGIIRKVGSNVRDLKIGDRVIMFEHGCLATRLTVPSRHCAKIPDELSFQDAATMPCVCSTVIYALLIIGRLEKGQVSAIIPFHPLA